MQLFHRYILGELFKTFFGVLLFLTLLFTLVLVVQEAVSQGIPFQHAIRLLPFMAVEQLRYSLPMTLLLATTTCFSRMSGSNEIIAIKALGIAPWRLLWPVWVFAVIVSLAGVWVNDFTAFRGYVGMAQIILYATEDTIYSKLQRDREFAIDNDKGFKIAVDRVENKKLIMPVITRRDPPMTIKAEQAEIRVDHQKGELEVVLVGLQSEWENGLTMNINGEISYQYPLPTISTNHDDARPSKVPLSAVSDQITKTENHLASVKKYMSANTSFAFATGNFSELSDSNLQYQKNALNYYYDRLTLLNLEPARRWASGFSCFFFVWIGAPLSIRMQKSDVFASFFACFLPILIVYYPLLMYGTTCAKDGILPPQVIWLANLCLGVIGYFLLKSIHKN